MSSCLPTKWRDQEFDSGVEGQAEWKGFFAPPPLLQPTSAYLGPACRADPLHSSPRSVSTKGGSGSPHHTAIASPSCDLGPSHARHCPKITASPGQAHPAGVLGELHYALYTIQRKTPANRNRNFRNTDFFFFWRKTVMEAQPVTPNLQRSTFFFITREDVGL